MKDGAVVGGEGLVRMLEAVERCGSIRLAAKSLGMNYKRFWLRLSNAERMLGLKLVERGRGRSGSRLTDEGRKLVSEYARFAELVGRQVRPGERRVGGPQPCRASTPMAFLASDAIRSHPLPPRLAQSRYAW